LSSTPNELLTNSALEFHDSEVGSVTVGDRELRVVFSAAYVHRSPGQPGVDAGKGYLAPVVMTFSEAEWDGELSACCGGVSTGDVECNGVKASLISLPYSSAAPVVACLQFTNGALLTVRAAAMQCRITGQETFVESYAC
jgi:hypothetical protein